MNNLAGFRKATQVLAACLICAGAHALETNLAGHCVVPSKPGGGFDLTCKLAQKAFKATLPQAQTDVLRISYMPGGIGAVAWNSVVSQRRAVPDTLFAFSGGSLLNIALGKFGNAAPQDVRWVATIGADYGMVAVRKDSPYKTLDALLDAIKQDPAKITIGASGTVGSQDWLKMNLLAKQHNIDSKALRFVALEGGGETFSALLGGHVQAVSGDASEAALHAAKGDIRILAVMSDVRLPGALEQVPTAREQGYDLNWTIVRGVYMSPQTPDVEYQKWIAAFELMMTSADFARMRAAHGLFPFSMTGAALTAYVETTVENYGRQVKALGLKR